MIRNIITSRNLLTFLLLIVIVLIMQFLMLYPQLDYGLAPDDIAYLSEFKLLGENPYGKVKYVWENIGPHFTSAVYFVGSLERIFGFDFRSYYLFIHITKIISVLSLFILVLVITKNRLPAMFSSLIFALHYSPVGSLEMVVRGNDYLALTFLNAFLILYYQAIDKKGYSVKRLAVISLLLLLSFAANLIRIFPILGFILFIEAYFFIRDKSLLHLKRAIIIFAPYLLIILINPKIVWSQLIQMSGILQKIVEGNWHFALSPSAFLGSMFFLENRWGFFGNPQVSSLQSFAVYLSGFFIVLFLPSLLLAFTLFKKPKRFLLTLLIFNLVGNMVVFLTLENIKLIDPKNKIDFNFGLLPMIILGNYIVSLAFSFWREWQSKTYDRLFFLLWISPLFSFIFIVLTFFFSAHFSGIHGYLTIPSQGIAVFTAVSIFLVVRKIDLKTKGKLKLIPISVFIFLFLIYLVSNQLIQQYFRSHLDNGMRASDQKAFRKNLEKYLTGFSYKEPSLFYFDSRDDSQNNAFYGIVLFNEFPHWMQVYDQRINNKCLLPRIIVNDEKKLFEITVLKNGELGFMYQSYCHGEYIYRINNFYAFKLKDRQVIDIKSEVIEQLGRK